MEVASAVRKIPLDRLVLSPANARKAPPSAAEDAELKASIKARGLKQNLVVCPAPEGGGRYAVTAGGRRLKALEELAAEGVVPADYEVPCLVEKLEAALETSLMENTVRAAMHPADEFAAMAALIDAGERIEAVASRFGERSDGSASPGALPPAYRQPRARRRSAVQPDEPPRPPRHGRPRRSNRRSGPAHALGR